MKFKEIIACSALMISIGFKSYGQAVRVEDFPKGSLKEKNTIDSFFTNHVSYVSANRPVTFKAEPLPNENLTLSYADSKNDIIYLLEIEDRDHNKKYDRNDRLVRMSTGGKTLDKVTGYQFQNDVIENVKNNKIAIISEKEWEHVVNCIGFDPKLMAH